MQYLNLPFSIKVMHRLKALKDLLACLKMLQVQFAYDDLRN